MKRGHAQTVDDAVAFETATRVPQYVTERVLQYELVTQPLDILPVDRIRCSRRTMIDVNSGRPIIKTQIPFSY